MKSMFIIGCAFLAACSSTQLGRNETASQSPRAKEIRTAMDRAVIPEVNLQNVATADALRMWSEASREAHPQHFGVKYVLSYPMIFSQGPAKQNTSSTKPTRVSVHRRNITSRRLLDEICAQSGLSWSIMGKAIVIKPRNSAADERS